MQKKIKNLKRKLNSPDLFEEIIKLAKEANFRPVLTDEKSPQNKAFLFNHAIRTGEILGEINSSKETILAGILYQFKDLILPTSITKESQQKEIEEIIFLTKKLKDSFGFLKEPKVKSIKDWQKILFDEQSENIRKSFFALTKDVQPILVLIADSLDEIESLTKYYNKDKQKNQAIIALEIMAPLCYALGMESLKMRFEDAAFPILYPKEYDWLIKNFTDDRAKIKAYTEKIKPKIKKILQDKGLVKVEVFSRAKGLFSLYQKLLKHDMDFNQIFDVVAVRVVLENTDDCYKALGFLHQFFQPLPNRTKDYIGNPKKNGYRAIHTTVIGPEDKNFEIQIKTIQMHQEAEFGIAAHLGYKGKINSKAYKQFFWLDKIRQWKTETATMDGLSKDIKKGLFKDLIFVSTPKGDVINLPKDSTPVDFAYAVHSDIGDHCEGALVNQKMVPLDYKLQNNDHVEILTSKNHSPSEKWLHFVKTQKAKNKISKFIEQSLGQAPQSITQAAVSAITEKVALIKKIIPERFIKAPKILIGGEQGIAFKLAMCCHPKQPEPILAFITQGEGASIHKETCPNLAELKQKWPERVIPAKWINS
ncbi:MAG: TGS domain-containing protein [Candidatus Pacebacteria bacterium]|nr:TGS domain-containing protein [Candidatus Paceibacterota bacterium]